ncbi:hypothetical protein GCM10010532_037490 [Dactylosporangium siamense]|uniref:Uncharacterized protein n=1 Tax=Dactylosporangium siamense TaxID=685454 RepID=A0A919UAX1_9ACTN|nr:hypothetical protein Dsi01nite_029920 [Dactylosporangium siamense]
MPTASTATVNAAAAAPSKGTRTRISILLTSPPWGVLSVTIIIFNKTSRPGPRRRRLGTLPRYAATAARWKRGWVNRKAKTKVRPVTWVYYRAQPGIMRQLAALLAVDAIG